MTTQSPFPMQIRRTRTPDNPPEGLAQGQLACEMASNPPRLWCGVPTSIDPSGRRELLTGGEDQSGKLLGGKLIYDSPTTLRFIPYRGGFVKHNGTLHLIPVEGIPITYAPPQAHYVFLGPGPTELFYHVVSGAPFHRPSQTPGNEGVEVFFDRVGGIEDSNYTLLGMVQGDAGQFIDEPRRRFVRSWFNREPIAFRGANVPLSVFGANSGVGNVFANCNADFLSWADEVVYATFYLCAHTTGQNWIDPLIALDDRTPLRQSVTTLQFYVWSAIRMANGCAALFGDDLSEGYHRIWPGYEAAVAIQLYGDNSPLRVEGTIW